MMVVEMGNLESNYPDIGVRCGIVISATKEELKNLPPLLFREVELKEVS